ncbi:unnamed protein product, partial [Rotaria sordida]
MFIDILFRQPPRKNTVSMQQAQQMYQHQQQYQSRSNHLHH